MYKMLIVILGMVTFSAFGQDTFPYGKHAITTARSAPTLKAWMQVEKVRLTKKNIGYSMGGPPSLCTAMKSVSLGCSHNERVQLVQYLFAHGVDLFPCEDGSNPHTREICSQMAGGDRTGDSFYNYIGNSLQNEMLEEGIKVNHDLFKGGDLTASAAKKWKL